MTEELLAAYRGTRYAVLDVDGGTLAEARVGEHRAELDEVLDAHGAGSGVFITAWNPRSVPTDDETNAEAHARLAGVLDERGLTVLAHAGFGEDPAWRAEHGFFVLDLAEREALEIAVELEQNAVVVVRRGQPAQLVLSDVMSS
jgi:hypothetical protein